MKPASLRHSNTSKIFIRCFSIVSVATTISSIEAITTLPSHNSIFSNALVVDLQKVADALHSPKGKPCHSNRFSSHAIAVFLRSPSITRICQNNSSKSILVNSFALPVLERLTPIPGAEMHLSPLRLLASGNHKKAPLACFLFHHDHPTSPL